MSRPPSKHTGRRTKPSVRRIRNARASRAFCFAAPAPDNSPMNTRHAIALATFATMFARQVLPATGHEYPLDTAKGLTLVDVQAEPVTFEGRRGLRVTLSPDAKQRLAQATAGQSSPEQLAVIDGTDFTNGVIEAEIAG